MDSVITQDDPEVQLGLLEAISVVVQAFLKCLELDEGATYEVLGTNIVANTSPIPKELLSDTSNLCVNKLLELMATKVFILLVAYPVDFRNSYC